MHILLNAKFCYLQFHGTMEPFNRLFYCNPKKERYYASKYGIPFAANDLIDIIKTEKRNK